MVQRTEYIDLAKLCNPRQKYKSQICRRFFQYFIESLKHISQWLISWRAHRIEQRRIVFVDQNDDLFPRLLNRAANEIVQS